MRVPTNRPVLKVIIPRQRSDYYGIQEMIIFKLRITPHRCNEQTHQSNWIMREIHKQLPKSQPQNEINYPLHT